MELWASGFNAWGQLDFEKEPGLPRDLEMTFKCILKDEHLELLRTTLSATLVRTSKGIQVAGHPDFLTQLHLEDPDRISRLVIAGNDTVVEAYGGCIKQYDSLSKYLENSSQQSLEIEGEIVQIAVGQTIFAALTKDGSVWTWGDGRYESCLGREVSKEFPASTPFQIEDLSDLPTGPITKIASGGYVTAALTAGGDLYVFGGRAGQPKMLDSLTGEPTPVEFDGDFLDIAVGNDHMLALSTDHRLFVIGEGGNGQLGLEECVKIEEWKEVTLPLKNNQRAVSVYAGYKSSFVILCDVT